MGGLPRPQPSLGIPSSSDLRLLLDPTGWLHVVLSPETQALARTASDACHVHDHEWWTRRFSSSPVTKAQIQRLVWFDHQCVFHAIDALRKLVGVEVQRVVPLIVSDALPDENFEIDHIGVEVFGRLEWYLDAIRHNAGKLGYTYVKDSVFPSVQVKRALRAEDPTVQDVRIARAFLRFGDRVMNVELFEAAQAWERTMWRQISLYACQARTGARLNAWNRARLHNRLCTPVGHFALRVPGWKNVAALHQKLLVAAKDPVPPIQLYSESLDFNPGDMSANTKLILAALVGDGTLLRNRILEVLSYGERRTKARR